MDIDRLMERKQKEVQKKLDLNAGFIEACKAGADAVTEWKHQKFLRGLVEQYERETRDLQKRLEFWNSRDEVQAWLVKNNQFYPD